MCLPWCLCLYLHMVLAIAVAFVAVAFTVVALAVAYNNVTYAAHLYGRTFRVPSKYLKAWNCACVCLWVCVSGKFSATLWKLAEDLNLICTAALPLSLTANATKCCSSVICYSKINLSLKCNANPTKVCWAAGNSSKSALSKYDLVNSYANLRELRS